MKKFSLFSLLLSGSLLSLFGQILDVTSSKGLTSFYPNVAIEFPDSVVKYDYVDAFPDPNISRTIYYYSENQQLDSILEIYEDNNLEYTSGNTTTYNYDEYDRVSAVRKVSWNSHFKDLVITIDEEYEYADEVDYVRYSQITWSIAAHNSSVLVEEQYNFGDHDFLDSYVMHVPPEINPDSVTYLEAYEYDSFGSLVNEKKDLCIKDESIQHTEKEHYIQYNSEDLPGIIHTSEREKGDSEWNEVGQVEFFYDDAQRVTMRKESQKEGSMTLIKAHLLNYDNIGHLVSEVSYAADASEDYTLLDSTVYFYSNITGFNDFAKTGIDFSVFPNPTDGWIHVQCGDAASANITIFNATGKAIRRIERATGLTDIDLSDQPPGVFFINFRNNLGALSKRVLKY